MHRAALMHRNRKIAEAFHRTPIKHKVRGWLLRGVSHLPVSNGRPPAHERILLIRPDHLGDVLLTTPAIRALREAAPHGELHALIGPWSAHALVNNDDLDAIITLDFPGFNRAGNASLRSPYTLALKTARQLRQIGYSHAIIMRPDHWWGAMVAFLAGIPVRIGHAHGDVAPFLTDVVSDTPDHCVMQNASLLARWTGTPETHNLRMHYAFTEEEDTYITDYLNERGISTEQRLFCIHPGAGTWVKRWDNGLWAQVADMLVDQLDATVVITGTDSEMPLAQEIAAQMQHTPVLMAGDTQVAQLAALFARALVVLGPDSGPMHLAAAVNTPTVALFGPADPTEFAPWGRPDRHIVLTHDLACRPCRVLDWGTDTPANHPCVREISVGRVLEAARTVAHR